MNGQLQISTSSPVLVWAREAAVMSKKNASEKTGLSLSRLNQLEKGAQKPNLDELKSLAKTYNRTIATLLLKQPPQEKPLPKDCRTLNSNQIGSFHEKTVVAIRKARAMAKSLVELKEDFGIPRLNFSIRATLETSPKKLAQKLRKEWLLSEIREIENLNHALEAYIEKVEELGVAVFQLSLTQDGLRGFSIVDDIVPIIGIKRGGEAPTSKIFTLFHELGHIILNEGGLCDLKDTNTKRIEIWCNAFSAEILVPTDELLNLELVKRYAQENEKEWVKQHLINIGKRFHVGPLVILRSLLENRLTSQAFYKNKHEAWNKPQFGRAKNPEGRNIAKETIKEKGRTYVSLAFKAFDQNRIDIKDLSDFLGVRMAYIGKTRELLTS